ncbi:conserved Plasmodium protein, unknown function [Plasmodium malariae]|uniref:Uncharacterized protein n=1 Tax=Plasmodium malariae TaxID=5858 RepID=A0A1C3KZU8_PLAMA|nr:conserved Plasmodium protein, unknown function [Plasmodium malariae]
MVIKAIYLFLYQLIVLTIINFRKREKTICKPYWYYVCLLIVVLFCKEGIFIQSYRLKNGLVHNSGFVNITSCGRKKGEKLYFKYNGNKLFEYKKRRGLNKHPAAKGSMKKDVKAIEGNIEKWEINKKRQHRINSYFNSLCSSNVLNKNVDRNVNFDDGEVNFFVLNSNPSISFLTSNIIREKKTYNEKKKKKQKDLEKMGRMDKIGKAETEDNSSANVERITEGEKVQYRNTEQINDLEKKKVRLKLKRGFLNEVYEREKKKLNYILFSLKDKNIFKKKDIEIKENMLLLNGQTIKTEEVKQYLFYKSLLEYYENIRDQKKILTLDLWSKEINVSVENLKKLIVYIYKMKNLVQKEDEDLLVRRYFYNKTNMYTLFRDNYKDGNAITFDFTIPGEEKEKEKINNQMDVQQKDKMEVTKTKERKKKFAKGKAKRLIGEDARNEEENGKEESGNEPNEPNEQCEQTEYSKHNEPNEQNKTDTEGGKGRVTSVEKNESNKYDIFSDQIGKNEIVLYKDCENLINKEVQQFLECIKDIVFFENSIYILEKLENRPPLYEELTYAYNYDKEKMVKNLENKIRLSQKLVFYFIPLISNIIRKAEVNFSSNLSEDDFLLVSLEAVKNGFKKYDIEKLGIKNLTKYVYMWAKNSTYNYYQKHKSFISISPHTYKDYNKIKKFEDQFLERNERKPNIKEISDGLKFTVERVEKALCSVVNIIDSEKPITYQNSNSAYPEKNTYKDLIINSDDINSFNDIMYNDIVIKGLRKFICKSLKKKINKLIIFMKFGLFLKKKSYTDEEICEILKITTKKFQKHFQDSLNEIKNYIGKIKKNKGALDSTFDLISYINLSQCEFLGNDFSQILV